MYNFYIYGILWIQVRLVDKTRPTSNSPEWEGIIMAITFDKSFSWLPQSKLQKDASEEQMLKDGQYYRLTYGSHIVFSDNKDINGLAQNPITELIRNDISTLKEHYNPNLTAWESMNNARRVALKNIEQEIKHATESSKNEKKFTKEQVNDKWHHNITSTSKQKTLLAMTNFWRIYWIFIRFNINELWLSWNHLFASIWVIDAATLSAHFDMLNATSCFLSIALFGLRFLIEIGTAIKHIAQAEDGEKLKQFFIEVHKRWSDSLNCVVWLVINLLTNYPAVCGIPLSVCYPLIAVVLLFDIWLSHQKHFEDDRKFESAIKLVDEDIRESFQNLSQKLSSVKKYFSDSSELATQLEKVREARKTISSSDNDGDLKTLNKLEALLLEKQALLDSKAVNDSLHEWNKTAVKFLFGAFSASVVISFWVTPPGAILGCYMICALSIASFMKGGDYAKIQELKQQLKAAKDDNETLFTVAELQDYKVDSQAYKNEVKKRINSIEQEINNKWNNLILDVAVMAVLPPLIIGSLAICWPLAIAAAVVAITYLAFKFVQPSSPKEELPKVHRYRLFSQDGLTDTKDAETASVTTDNTSRTNSLDSSISSSDDVDRVDKKDFGESLLKAAEVPENSFEDKSGISNKHNEISTPEDLIKVILELHQAPHREKADAFILETKDKTSEEKCSYIAEKITELEKGKTADSPYDPFLIFLKFAQTYRPPEPNKEENIGLSSLTFP